MKPNPTEVTLRARAGAHKAHALYGSQHLSSAARRAFAARFEAKADPRGELAPDERAKRAQHLLKAHMATLAAKSARARRRPLGKNDAA